MKLFGSENTRGETDNLYSLKTKRKENTRGAWGSENQKSCSFETTSDGEEVANKEEKEHKR